MPPTQTQISLFQKVKDEREKHEPLKGPSVVELIPEIADRLAYWDWIGQRHRESFEELFTPVSRKYFTERVERINLFLDDSEEYDELLEAATEFCYEPILLGSTAKALYRLKPDFYGLIPHRDETALSTHSARLGVNTNLPTSRRQQHLSEASQDSAESDDMGGHGGFIFHQLGELMSWPFLKGSGRPPGDDSQILLDTDCWLSTGFFVVARLSSNGYAQRLYLIMDSFPRLDSGGRKAIESERWGYLPFDELKRFTCARLTGPHLLSGRSYDTPFALDEVIEKPVELVYLKRGHAGANFIRETVHHV